ncbi:cytochrome P450 7B1-like [Periophthalmus magnuspinnatus]|uniref:cytochrome P450 7B1-like n=1 Tax=Periophthalmus magnuspinnatus TaxID=409849 RepID=UPI002436BC4C|nr:cytochrome P450 7B1-like [Periophthalmus magnuspinnatus]
MTFILNPLHFPSIIKHGRQLDLHKFTNIVAPYTFGFSPTNPERFPGLREQIEKSFQLLQGSHLSSLSDNMMKNLLLVFREDYLSCGEWKTSQLHDFCLSVALETSFMTMYGRTALEQRQRNLEQIRQDFVFFDNKLPLLTAQVPLWLLGNIKSVRQKLIDCFLPNVMSKWSSPSPFIQRRSFLFEQYDLSSHDRAAQHFAMFWASVGNTSPAMFWCVYYLLRHEEALQAVRLELQEVMSQEELEVRPDSDQVLTQEQLDKLVVLESVVSETLRLSTFSMNVRVAQEDLSLSLDSTWSIRKGDIVSIFPHNTHMDPEIYPDPTSFHFDRYLDNGKEKTNFYKSGQRVKYYLMPFGSGATKCPGRYLAVQEIKQFVCLLLLLFDVELCDPKTVVRPNLTRAGLGIMQPAHDVHFRYRLRRPLQVSTSTKPLL